MCHCFPNSHFTKKCLVWSCCFHLEQLIQDIFWILYKLAIYAALLLNQVSVLCIWSYNCLIKLDCYSTTVARPSPLTAFPILSNVSSVVPFSLTISSSYVYLSACRIIPFFTALFTPFLFFVLFQVT